MIGSSFIVPRTKRTLQRSTKTLFVTADNFDHGVGFRLVHSTTSLVQTLLRDLRQLDTSSLCDAEKTIANNFKGKCENGDIENGIKLMNDTIRPMNYLRRENWVRSTSGNPCARTVMAGVARTVSFTEPNDFLPVMRALALEAKTDEVLVVDTMSSTRAVAGEIFVSEAVRKGVAGIIIDGPIRDTAHLDQVFNSIDPAFGNPLNNENRDENGKSQEKTPMVMRLYAKSITPYSGTTQSPGEMQAEVVTCGGIEVRPGDIVVGDDDGILVGNVTTFSKLVPIAKKIQCIENKLLDRISSSSLSEKNSLASMTNLDEHVQRRIEGKASDLEFRI